MRISMASTATGILRRLLPPGPAASARSVEDIQAQIGLLTAERQQLREGDAGHDALERNRVDLVEAQRALSHALIARHVPHAA
jgi:hypothetical protein